jgi:hypothetical protein
MELTGLNGTSLTAFLAALGVLRLLTEAGFPVRLGWRSEVPHTARLECPPLRQSELAESVASALQVQLEAFDPFPGRLKLSEVAPSEFRAAVAAATERPGRLAVDLLAAFGSDAAFEPVAPTKAQDSGTPVKGRGKPRKGAEPSKGPEGVPAAEGKLLDPPWSVLNGAMQRNLLGIVRRLADLAGPPEKPVRRGRDGQVAVDAQPLAARVRSVLEGPWQESDAKASLYLDPSLREHAYRWSDPTTDPAQFDGIANLLAVVGLSLLPTVPVDRSGTVTLASACCAPVDSRRNAVSWPIWRGMLGLGTVRRLLLIPGLTDKNPPGHLRARGIAVVMRAENYPIEGAKGARTYTSPEPVW